jgi:hypothetical protein
MSFACVQWSPFFSSFYVYLNKYLHYNQNINQSILLKQEIFNFIETRRYRNYLRAVDSMSYSYRWKEQPLTQTFLGFFLVLLEPIYNQKVKSKVCKTMGSHPLFSLNEYYGAAGMARPRPGPVRDRTG